MGRSLAAVAALAVLALAGCSRPLEGKGALAATVGGQRITVGDLEAEMRVTGIGQTDNPEVRKAVLERMILRKLQARSARDAGLSTSPDALRVRDIAREDFDATLDRTAALAKAAAPTDADAAAFVDAHPEMFANRTVYLIDQIRTAPNPGVEVVRALGPTKSLEEAEKVLAGRKVEYRRSPAAIDSLRSPPQLSIILAKLPAGEVFVIPEGSSVTINQVRASEARPVTGPPAIAFAKQVILAARQADALGKHLQSLRASQVTYGPAFAPKAPAAN